MQAFEECKSLQSCNVHVAYASKELSKAPDFNKLLTIQNSLLSLLFITYKKLYAIKILSAILLIVVN